MAGQVKYLEVIPLIAAQLIKRGDFLAPSYPNKKYGYGCILYDHVCDFSTEGEEASGPCSGLDSSALAESVVLRWPQSPATCRALARRTTPASVTTISQPACRWTTPTAVRL